MTSEEIRGVDLNDFSENWRAVAFFLREIAAQLAEVNERNADTYELDPTFKLSAEDIAKHIMKRP